MGSERMMASISSALATPCSKLGALLDAIVFADAGWDGDLALAGDSGDGHIEPPCSQYKRTKVSQLVSYV